MQPEYNTDTPSSLVAAGLLQGRAINLDTASVHALDQRAGVCAGSVTLRLPWIVKFVGGRTDAVAIKTQHDVHDTKQPRHPWREIQLMHGMSHLNVVKILNAYRIQTDTPTPRLVTFMPLYDFSLRDLLDHETFVPSSGESEGYELVAHSIAHQLLQAVAYIHDNDVAHRDINPSNVVMSSYGRVVLIDFGIAIKNGDETPGEMHFQVGTQPYRAPELIFASKQYDAQAIDVWALGATLSELYLPIVPCPQKSDRASSSSSTSEDDSEQKPRRARLFEPNSTDFALAASIFRVLGTPDEESWPESKDLPSFKFFTFQDFGAPKLSDKLVHQPESPRESLVALIQMMLQYPSQDRLRPRRALQDSVWNKVVMAREPNIGERCTSLAYYLERYRPSSVFS
ncbi:hypothetical protein OIV83_005852 [Microbotryomycetes sp. JL201]|nr:hypothetical protein OIV83_005852 [Microbotryomycetes sp. JL201]